MSELKKAGAGRRGSGVRSDCYIEIEPASSGGLHIDMQSKVESFFGESLKKQLEELADFFGIKNGTILFEDTGALPFVIAARFEAAVRRLHGGNLGKEYWPEMQEFNTYPTQKERFRRSRLYLPGNEPKFFLNAGLHKPDGIILDLEDSVAPAEKDAAQLIVRNALRTVNFYGCERMVRINQLPQGLKDLKYVVPHNVHILLIPKVEYAEQIKQVEEEVLRLKDELKIEPQVYFMPIIESALGVINAYEIAMASKFNCALAIGLEDYTADIGAERTDEGRESFFARSMLVNAARAARIQPIDTVYSDVTNMDGLREAVEEAKALGFEGKGCIHPRQIDVVHEAFAPKEAEIEKAKKITLAFEDAEKRGLGAVSLGSKMIDPPVVKRALRVIKLAEQGGLLAPGWRDER